MAHRDHLLIKKGYTVCFVYSLAGNGSDKNVDISYIYNPGHNILRHFDV